MLEHHESTRRVASGEVEQFFETGALQQLHPDSARNRSHARLGRVTQLVIKLHQLFSRRHAHAHLPMGQRELIELHFLIEQMGQFVDTLRRCRHGASVDNRLIRALDRLHIVARFDFHGQASSGRVFSLCGEAHPYGSIEI